MENANVDIQELRDSIVFCHTVCLCVLCVHVFCVFVCYVYLRVTCVLCVYVFCVFMCFVCLCVLCVYHKISIIFPNSMNHLIFVIVKQCVYLR